MKELDGLIESRSLEELMKMGYDIRIECKGVGRSYAMTFEATARRNQLQGEDYKEYTLDTYATHYHAVGDSIEEMAGKLLEKVQARLKKQAVT